MSTSPQRNVIVCAVQPTADVFYGPIPVTIIPAAGAQCFVCVAGTNLCMQWGPDQLLACGLHGGDTWGLELPPLYSTAKWIGTIP